LRARREASKHSTAPDLPGAEPGHQALEAGPCHRAAGRPAEIVVDDLDFSEASTRRHLNEFVLAALSPLKIRLHLRMGGLPARLPGCRSYPPGGAC
jgi:hypothetical protein